MCQEMLLICTNWYLPGASFLIGALLVLCVLLWLHRRAKRQIAKAERRAAQSDHLAELSMMTGGLAHEIKNPLSTIGLNAQLLSEDISDAPLPPDESHRIQRRLESLQREVDRLRTILEDFLQFAGRIQASPELHDLNLVVEELVDFFMPQAQNASIRFQATLSEMPAIAMVDGHLLKQALLNLLINATQALETNSENQPRELMIRVESLERFDALDGAPAIAIHVTDTGPGINDEAIKRIYQPYYSTKVGGTGLGLPIARRIIEVNSGVLQINTEPGHGTDFGIFLPRSSNDE